MSPVVRRPAAIALAFTAVALVVGAVLRLYDDEGMQAYLASTLVIHEPLAGLFCQKFKPLGAVLALPGALFGWTGHLVWTRLLAGAGVYLVGRAAGALHDRGWLASLVVATSPIYLLAAFAGHSNVHAVFLVGLALYLHLVRRQRFLAGVVLAAAVFARSECAILIAGLGALALGRRETRPVALGMAALLVAYVLPGALYHRDLLWLIHHTPALPIAETQTHEFDAIVAQPAYLQRLVLYFALVTPAWPLLFLPAWRRSTALERALLVLLVVSAAGLVGGPFLRVMRFNHSPRYFIALLPMIALALSRLELRRREPLELWAPALLATAGLLLLAAAPSGRGAAVLGVGLLPLALTQAHRLGPRLRPGLALVAATVVGVLSFRSETGLAATLTRSLPGPDLRRAVGWLLDHRDDRARGRIYTNVHQLDLYLKGEHPDFGRPVNYLVQYDIQLEIYRLSNHRNGQYRAILRGLGPRLYGRAAWACDLARRTDLSGDVFLLKRDYRLDYMLPPAYWRALSTEVARFGAITVRQGRAADPADLPALARLTRGDSFLQAPCQPASDDAARAAQP